MYSEIASSRILLVLDLDETLIYATEDPLERQPDFRCGPYHVYRRPYLDDFLRTMSRYFQLAVWTSGTDDYAAAIANRILPVDLDAFRFVWGRSRCTYRWQEAQEDFIYEKRLQKLKKRGYRLERMLLLDDSREKCAYNYGNAVYVRPWFGDEADQELKLLSEYLPSLAQVENVRSIEKRGWRLPAKP